MGCTHDRQGFYDVNINQLMIRKKTIINELTGYDKRPTKEDKRQMEIIDRQMRRELSNLKSKQFSNDEVAKNNNNCFYYVLKYEFQTLSTQWEKIISDDNSIHLNNDNDDEKNDSFCSEYLNENDNKNFNYRNGKNNYINEDSEEDSSKLARDLYDRYGSDC